MTHGDQIASSLRCVCVGGGHPRVVSIGTVVVVTIETPYNRTDRIHARAPRGRYSSSVQHDM